MATALTMNWEMFFRIALPVATKKAGRPIRQFISIIDLKGFPVSMIMNGDLHKLLKISANLDKLHPGMVARSFIINAPMMFSMGFNAIKGFLSRGTKDKLSILGKPKKSKFLIFPIFLIF